MEPIEILGLIVLSLAMTAGMLYVLYLVIRTAIKDAKK